MAFKKSPDRSTEPGFGASEARVFVEISGIRFGTLGFRV